MAKILVIDDDKGVVKAIESMLIKQNYEVITAHDGKEGFEKAQSEKPDLIILDVMMPSMSGYEVIRFLRMESYLVSQPIVPVIVLTAKEKLEEVFKLEGAKEYLVKPLDPPVLLAKVEELLKK